jgi:hypothetical protein
VAGQTVNLCIIYGLIAIEASQTANSSNDQKFDLKVANTSMTA